MLLMYYSGKHLDPSSTHARTIHTSACGLDFATNSGVHNRTTGAPATTLIARIAADGCVGRGRVCWPRTGEWPQCHPCPDDGESEDSVVRLLTFARASETIR